MAVRWFKFDEDALVTDDNIRCVLCTGQALVIVRFRGRPTTIYMDDIHGQEDFYKGTFIKADELKNFFAFLRDTNKVLYYEAHVRNDKLYDDTYFIREDYKIAKAEAAERRISQEAAERAKAMQHTIKTNPLLAFLRRG